MGKTDALAEFLKDPKIESALLELEYHAYQNGYQDGVEFPRDRRDAIRAKADLSRARDRFRDCLRNGRTWSKNLQVLALHPEDV